jgi:hypothetical protein
MNIVRSTRAYERWLKIQLSGDIVAKDIEEKHEEMRKGAFPFLRATYWRWAEKILDICPELKDAPRVLAVGDIHVENFGTWRDVDCRLVWGVNDFDEAAKMPYALDVVRLATSAVLANVPNVTTGAITSNILRGYREGLAAPHAFVLDQRYRRLRRKFEVPEKKRSKFWNKMDPAKNLERARKLKRTKPRRPFVEALNHARPEPNVDLVFWPRTAGLGSLGRPRWIGYGEWHDAPVVREAKAIVPSAWTYAHGGSSRLRCQEIATGRHRAPDPWYELRKDGVLVRRLSPNSRKLEAKEIKSIKGRKGVKGISQLVNPAMLRDMGRDLAAVHLGTGARGKVILRDLERRKPRWLHDATMVAAAFVVDDQQEWRRRTRQSDGRR